MARELTVNVVANDGEVWQGSATNVIVRTTEGDLGVLYNHEPLMAILVPHATEIFTPEGERVVLSIDSGFVSVFNNHISILSPFGEVAREISVEEARSRYAALYDIVDSGEATDVQRRDYRRAKAQLRAAEKIHGQR